jgi:hypothetical protein
MSAKKPAIIRLRAALWDRFASLIPARLRLLEQLWAETLVEFDDLKGLQWE